MSLTKVIIADDEVPIREQLRLFAWEAHGYELAGEARHGQEALELCERLQPGIVVTDIVMPVMDGLRLARLLLDRQPALPVILLTSHREFDYARQALALGVSDYLLKGTFRDGELLAALDKAKARLSAPTSDSGTASASASDDDDAAAAAAKRFEIRHAEAFIDERLGEPFDLAAVAAHVGLSPNYFGLLFRKTTGESFPQYVKRKRLDKAAYLLRHSPLKVYEVAAAVGFPNYRHFTEVFCRRFGRSPREFRGGHG
ncbi:MAG: response regulator [Paenibacillaceae bacterium]|nr:response regulator [Paenibacillaceae bacterium]